ncbi:cytochrome c [Acidobacteria bacterium AH-259-D05]|nr:cytochrome c [Acidobacteria bacterium AH-259-D05]
MKRSMTIFITAMTLPVVLSVAAPRDEEKPAPGDTMTFSEKVKTGFPTRWGKLEVHTPWGNSYKYKGPNEAVEEFDLSPYRTPLKSKIVSRRWEGNPGMYLANEEFLSGFSFWMDLVRAGFPVAHFPELEWITVREGYWYSRYMLSYVQAQAHMGIHMIHGPYWTLKAMESHQKNRFIRDRGERIPSNKDMLLGIYAPIFAKRTGWPRVFEDANPTMLDYKSGDPHFLGPIPTHDTFADPQSDKEYAWGIPAYLIDWRNSRWSHDSMDTTINLGTVAQTMKKKLVWTRCFFKSNHEGPAPGDPSRTVELLGSSGGEGFRGLALMLGSLNGLLTIKASLIADEKGHLAGINPLTYDPAQGLRYIPHEISPELIMVGEVPERPYTYRPKDLSSQLWDQASLLWTTTDYYEQAFHFQKDPNVEAAAFSVDPPADGGLIEQRTFRVALGLSNMIVKNLEAMHRTSKGVLASEWTPKGKTGAEVSIQDSAMVIVALNDYNQRLNSNNLDPNPELRAKALQMAKAQADFLARVQGADGAFHERYQIASGVGRGQNTLMSVQFFGIRALIAAWNLTGEDIYLQRAKRTWNLLNSKYWHEPTGLYRSQLGSDVVIYTPWELAAAYGAIREMILASPAHRARPLLERFVRFWVQSLDNSGMQMSEDHNTGEISWGHISADDDGDGIPFLSRSHGSNGIAPVPAGKIAINIGGASNPEFSQIKGEAYHPATSVSAKYVTRASSDDVLLPEVEPVDESYVERGPVGRWMGWTGRLAPSKKIAIGSDRTGEQIFRQNCMVCHGQRGEGIFGFDLSDDMFEFPQEEVANTITEGRFEKGMPTWGQGVDDLNVIETEEELHLGNVLSEEEINRVAEYIKTGLAEKYKQTETYEAYLASIKSGTEQAANKPGKSSESGQ